ncbi:MAG: ABC transporter permease, partial [Candidatus Rokuibacteriota bacterium]
MRQRSIRHVTFTAGLAITALLLATAALSALWTPADPLAMAIGGRLQGPTPAHPFGTDHYGRDVLSRVMVGAVGSIAVGVIAVGIGAGLGVLIGTLSGWVGGWPDEGFMRLVDA